MPNLISFDIDLTTHEGARLAAVLDGVGPHWEPGEIHRMETQAHERLYSRLDPGQQACFDLLVAEGVLPEMRGWSR